MIPMVDLKGQYQTLKSEIDAGILQALEATQFILGPNVQAFEKEAAAYLGAEHAVSCANGTDALHLAVRAAGIGEVGVFSEEPVAGVNGVGLCGKSCGNYILVEEVAFSGRWWTDAYGPVSHPDGKGIFISL